MMVMRWACVVALICAGISRADVLHVPGEYATIQAAIDAAKDGDVVIDQGVMHFA